MPRHKVTVSLAAAVLLAVAPVQAAWIAYQVGDTVNGNQAYGSPLGLDFDATARIAVLALGAFDHQRNGIVSPITVRLRQRTGTGSSATGTQIVAPGVPATVAGAIPLQAGYAFVTLASPLILEPGSYTISAEGYGAGDLNGNSNIGAVVPRQTDGGGGLLTFVQSRYGSGAGFPSSAGEWGSGANLVPGFSFVAPSFIFAAVPEPAAAALLALSLAALAPRRTRR